MVMLNFNAAEVTPDSGSQDAIPKGWYKAAIESSEVKPTKDDPESFYLVFQYGILEGPYKGKKVWDRMNIRNKSPVAQEIAYKRLSAVCHAVGVIQCADTTQLHNLPMNIKVKLREGSGEYESSNEITAVKNINEVVGGSVDAAHAATPAMPAPAVPAAGGWTPPPAAAAPVATPPPAAAPAPSWAQQTATPPPPVALPPSASAPPPPVAQPAAAPAAPVAAPAAAPGGTTPPWLRK